MESLQWLVFLSRSEAVGEKTHTHTQTGRTKPPVSCEYESTEWKKDSALSLNLEGKKKCNRERGFN